MLLVAALPFGGLGASGSLAAFGRIALAALPFAFAAFAFGLGALTAALGGNLLGSLGGLGSLGSLLIGVAGAAYHGGGSYDNDQRKNFLHSLKGFKFDFLLRRKDRYSTAISK
jgi:hypothetical protein